MGTQFRRAVQPWPDPLTPRRGSGRVPVGSESTHSVWPEAPIAAISAERGSVGAAGVSHPLCGGPPLAPGPALSLSPRRATAGEDAGPSSGTVARDATPAAPLRLGLRLVTRTGIDSPTMTTAGAAARRLDRWLSGRREVATAPISATRPRGPSGLQLHNGGEQGRAALPAPL